MNFKAAQALVGEHLAKCKASGTSTKYLDKRITFSVVCNITIVCMTCNTNEKYTAKLRYLNKTINGHDYSDTKTGPHRMKYQEQKY